VLRFYLGEIKVKSTAIIARAMSRDWDIWRVEYKADVCEYSSNAERGTDENFNL
jgi:hypothetical protein